MPTHEPGYYRAHALPTTDMVAMESDEHGRLREKWRIPLTDPADRARIVAGVKESLALFRPPLLQEHKRDGHVFGEVLAVEDRGDDGADMVFRLDTHTDRKYVSVGMSTDKEHNGRTYDAILWELSLVAVPHHTNQRPIERLGAEESARYAALEEQQEPQAQIAASAPDYADVMWIAAPDVRARAGSESSESPPNQNGGGDNRVRESRAPVVASANNSAPDKEATMAEDNEKDMNAKMDALLESAARTEEYMAQIAKAMKPKDDPEASEEEEEGAAADAAASGPAADAEASAAAPEPVDITTHPEFVRMRKELDEAKAERNRAAAQEIVARLYEERALDEGKRDELVEIAASGPDGIKAIESVASAAPKREANTHRGRLAEASGPPAGAEAASKVYDVTEAIQRQRKDEGGDTSWTSCMAAAREKLGLS